MNRCAPQLAFLIACCLAFVAEASAQEEPAFRTRFPREVRDGQPVLTCRRVSEPPKLDGEVDRDPVWQRCEPTAGAWTQLGTKEPSSRQTVVYACFDSENLYLGFVCEEPELQNLVMEGSPSKGDCVEAVIEVGGLNGEGDVYSFTANMRGREQGWGFDRLGREILEGQLHPWKSAGKFGPNRWMIEMEIPFSSLRRERSTRRFADPRRGEVLGIKLARMGPVMKSGEKRMASTWNVQLPYSYLYICGYNGLLYFEDSNTLADGDFAAEPSAWKQTGDAKRIEGGVALAAGATLSQKADVRPDSFYLFELTGEAAGTLSLAVDGKPVNLDADGAGQFWSGPERSAVVVTVKAEKPVALRRVHMRCVPGEEPPGAWCLTNNYRRADRNIRNLLPDAPVGKYRYVKLDYAGRAEADDNPAHHKGTSWAWDPTLKVRDVGGEEGWIAFDKGSLTGRPEPVFWQTVNPVDYNGWGRHEFTVIDVDLGQEYFVRGVDLLKPGPYMLNIEVWGRGGGDEEWTYLHTSGGHFVEPSKRAGYLGGFASVRGLDSVVRHVRFRATERYPQFPQMDGVQEFWIWGEPKGDRRSGEMKPFKPWVSKEIVPKREPKTWTPDRGSALIVPRPRKMTLENAWFVASDRTRIVFQDEAESRRVARQIRDEMTERWNVTPALVAEKDLGDDDTNVIYVGQPRAGEFAKKLANTLSLDVSAEKPAPQGYGIRVTPERAVVLGRDGEGLYWGVQSLMMAMRWRNAEGPLAPASSAGERVGVRGPQAEEAFEPEAAATGNAVLRPLLIAASPRPDANARAPFVEQPFSFVGSRHSTLHPDLLPRMSRGRGNEIADTAEAEPGGPSVRAMTVLDWPGTLDRATYHRRGYAALLCVPYSEVDRIKRVCRLLSRFKYTAIYLNANFGRQTPDWPKGALADLCREVKSEYRLEIRPIMLTTEEEGGGWWRDVIERHDAWDLAEHNPDEPPQELKGSLNFCPLRPESYRLMFDKYDRTIEEYGSPGKSLIFGGVYASVGQGARWAQCRTCLRSGKPPEEIYLYFLHRCAEHMESRGVKGVLRSPWFRWGPPDPKDRRLASADPRNVPGWFIVDLSGSRPAGGEALAQYENFIRENLDPQRTANGPDDWPSVERIVLGPHTETEITHSLAGGEDGYWGGQTRIQGNLTDTAETLWYAPEARPAEPLDWADIAVWVNAWWHAREFPAWRNGARPGFVPVDLREFANHASHATGTETLQAGRAPAMDLSYLDTGMQYLGGIEFHVIDPAQNDGKGMLMLGRPPRYATQIVKDLVAERAGPVPVGRKLASIAFLRAKWRCVIGGEMWLGNWLRPTCRVVYDDDTWLVVDSYFIEAPPFCNVDWNSNGGIGQLYRLGWQGNTPRGQNAWLKVVEWVNPYPEKTVKALDWFTPDMEDEKGRRTNVLCEGVVAVTGIEATNQDVRFWSAKKDRPPLLPPLKPRPEGLVELKSSRTAAFLNPGLKWAGQFAGLAQPVAFTGALMEGTGGFLYGRFDAVRTTASFGPFGATVTFSEPVTLARVEIIGPMCNWGPGGEMGTRRAKVDVAVEISPDGKEWQKAGAVRGISDQTDFQPVDLPDAPIKAVRLTGDPTPYHAEYRQTRIISGLFTGERNYPQFAWRLFAPGADRK